MSGPIGRRPPHGLLVQVWHSVLEAGLVLGTLPFVWLTLLPGGREGEARATLSLVPLADLATMPAYQVVGNLLVFAAVGLLGPVRFQALRSFPRVVLLAAVGSVLIETAQYVLVPGRVSSVDDVLLNATGAGLFALVPASAGRLLAARARRAGPTRERTFARDVEGGGCRSTQG